MCVCVWFHKFIYTHVFQLFFGYMYIYIYKYVCVCDYKCIYIYDYDDDDDDDDDDPDCSEIWFSCGALPPAWVPCFFSGFSGNATDLQLHVLWALVQLLGEWRMSGEWWDRVTFFHNRLGSAICRCFFPSGKSTRKENLFFLSSIHIIM